MHKLLTNFYVFISRLAVFSCNDFSKCFLTQSPSPRLQRSFNIRLSVKSDEHNSYENMQISSILTPTNSNVTTSLVCIARRLPPNERLPGGSIEQFTTKLLIDGHLIGIDNSGVSAGIKEKIGKVCESGHKCDCWLLYSIFCFYPNWLCFIRIWLGLYSKTFATR